MISVDIINSIEKKQMRTDLPVFGPSDTVRVHFKVVEGPRTYSSPLMVWYTASERRPQRTVYCTSSIIRCRWCRKDISPALT